MPPDLRAGDVVKLGDGREALVLEVGDPIRVVPRRGRRGEFDWQKVEKVASDSIEVVSRPGPTLLRGDLVTMPGGGIGRVERKGAMKWPPGLSGYAVKRWDGKRAAWQGHGHELAAADLGPVDAEDAARLLPADQIPPPRAALEPSRRTEMVAASHPAASRAAETPSLPPLPPGELTEIFAKVALSRPFRRYQSLALDAFEQARSAGRRRAYLVMPPGSGKTVLGLEIARRLGNRTLALGPNTAIQSQWVSQWDAFAPAIVAAGTSTALGTPITALTYQAICNIDSHNPGLDEESDHLDLAQEGEHPLAGAVNQHLLADVVAQRGKARRLVAQGGDHEQLLSMLHPNGRALIERIKSTGQWTIILDECHHLLEMWGYLLRALVHELGEGVFLVGLTATPPSEMGSQESGLYQELFGRADFEVPTPAVVKEGNLAPYQELCYLTTPLDHELDYIRGEQLRFQELITNLMEPHLGTVSFLAWLQSRVVERLSRQGAQVSWAEFEADRPDLARASLRFFNGNRMPIPAGARLREEDRQALTADDWVALIDDYCMGHLKESADQQDMQAWEMIRASLPSLGHVLTRQGIRSYVSPVDRVLLLSGAKAVAAGEILARETSAMGPRLRALLLCDYEVAGSELVAKLGGVLDAQAGSAGLLLKVLVADPTTASLDPILVTGKTVACARATAALLIPWLVEQAPELAGRLGSGELFEKSGEGWDQVVEVRPAQGAWEPSLYLPLVTRYFEAGSCRCLLGTRGLLGEGWDAKSVNVLVDLTGVTTTTSVHQMRGRSLRLDPNLPRKVANNWDVVCVAADHPKGSADYDRFVRKHRNYYALTAVGEIESGVSHVDSRLSPFGPPLAAIFGAVNSDLLDRADTRDHAYELWGVGRPYSNLPSETVRIRFGRSPGTPALRPPARVPGAPSAGLGPGLRVVAGLASAGAAEVVGVAASAPLAGDVAALVLVAGGLAWAGRAVRDGLTRSGPSGTLGQLAAAVAEGLAGAGVVGSAHGAAAVRVLPQPDGYYRCYLAGASLAESEVFATALDELLAPIESPRYVIPRYLNQPPGSAFGGLVAWVRSYARPGLGATVVYHAVPSALASNRGHVDAFAQAWRRYVGPGEPLFHQDPAAQAVIQLQRGEDPFDITTQMRTLWS